MRVLFFGGNWLNLAVYISTTLSFSLSLCASLRLVSWNLLASPYATPTKYPWCPPQYLEWEYRKSKIVPKLVGSLHADLLCLQEIQIDAWPDFFRELQGLYPTGILQNMTNDHPVANAVLLGPGWHVSRVESRSRILIVVLRRDQNDTKANTVASPLYLANVHLEAGMSPESNGIRYFQLKSLFKRLRHHCQLDKIEISKASIVLAGDFNMLPSNPLHDFLSQGRLQDPNDAAATSVMTTTKLLDAYYGSKATASGTDMMPLDDHSQPTQHSLLSMTYAKGGILDYIWTSEHIRIKNTLFLHPQVTSSVARQWPSLEYPSDHLPIGMDFDW